MREQSPAIGHNGGPALPDDRTASDFAKEFWDFVNFIRCSGLPAPSRHVAIEIWLHMRPGKMIANPSAARIAQFTGLSERTVRSSFKVLAKAPFFSVSASQGGRHQTRTFRAVSFQAVSELGALMDAKARATLQGNDDDERGKVAVFQARNPAAVAPLRLINPAGAAGLENRNPAAAAPFSEQNPAAVAGLKPETLQNPSKNPAGAAPEATLEATKEKEIPPTPQGGGAQPAKKSRARGAKIRLSTEWSLPVSWRERTKEKFGVDDPFINREAERFKRYWTSPDARNPMKADWLATWENWIDRALDRMPRQAKPTDRPSSDRFFDGVL